MISHHRCPKFTSRVWQSVSRYKQPLRLRIRNKILRSANTRHDNFYFFFCKINIGDLHVTFVYCCVFWCEFNDLVGFFGCYFLTRNTNERQHRKTAGGPDLVYSKAVCGLPKNPSNCRFFRPKAIFYHRSTAVNVQRRNSSTHACCWKSPRPMSKIPSFSWRCDIATGHGLWLRRSTFPRPPVQPHTKFSTQLPFLKQLSSNTFFYMLPWQQLNIITKLKKFHHLNQSILVVLEVTTCNRLKIFSH